MQTVHVDEVEYPDSDGQPMADNTLQFAWIAKIKENLNFALPDFVAGDLLWYPVRGSNTIRRAPDVLVALGRPKGYRGSYKQWEEDGAAPHVVFEVLSPRNTAAEMLGKLEFYERYGAQEFYIVDPDARTIRAWFAEAGKLQRVDFDGHLESPRLGIRFEQTDDDLVIRHVDGTVFREAEEVLAENHRARALAHAAEERAEAAQQKAEAAQQQADAERTRAEALAARLRELGLDPGA